MCSFYMNGEIERYLPEWPKVGDVFETYKKKKKERLKYGHM